jgi:flagellar basal body-associated protein FliL
VKAGKKTILLVGIPLGLGLAAGLAVVLLVLKPFAAPPPVPDPGPDQRGVMLPLDTKVVNLVPGGDFKYAKVGVTLELRPDMASFYDLKAEARTAAETLVVKDMADVLPLLDDAVARVVSSKTSTELLNDTGREQLKAELLEAIRAVLDGESPAAGPAASASSGAAASGAPAASAAAATGPSQVLGLYFTDLVMQ